MLCSTGSPGAWLRDLLSCNKASVSTDIIKVSWWFQMLTVVVVDLTHRCKEYFCSDVADPGYSQIGHWLLNAPRQVYIVSYFSLSYIYRISVVICHLSIRLLSRLTARFVFWCWKMFSPLTSRARRTSSVWRVACLLMKMWGCPVKVQMRPQMMRTASDPPVQWIMLVYLS